MTTQNTTTIVERSVDRIKKSIDIIFARFENIKIMIKCNSQRIDMIRENVVPRLEKKIKRLEQTIMDHIDPTVDIKDNKTYEMLKKMQKEAKAIKKMHKYFDDKYNNMELMINDPDDGRWGGR